MHVTQRGWRHGGPGALQRSDDDHRAAAAPPRCCSSCSATVLPRLSCRPAAGVAAAPANDSHVHIPPRASQPPTPPPAPPSFPSPPLSTFAGRRPPSARSCCKPTAFMLGVLRGAVGPAHEGAHAPAHASLAPYYTPAVMLHCHSIHANNCGT